jgi:hypothetical protein
MFGAQSGSFAAPLGGVRRIRVDTTFEEVEMALSDQLTKLAARAKEAEDHAAAAKQKARADLEQDVEQSRAAAQTQADSLRDAAEAHRGRISAWWHDVQRTWNEHVAKVHDNIEAKKAEVDSDRAEAYADDAEEDAAFAINYAYAAIDEAEYAVLDATLARVKADELAASA